MKYGIINNFVNGEEVASQGKLLDIYSPLDGAVIGQTYLSLSSELDVIVKHAANAQKEWAKVTLKKRSEIFYRYRELLLANRDALAIANREENGKSETEAYAGVDKAIELTEFACSIPQIATDEIEEVSGGIMCQSMRRPLGVVASITPFNFPVMVPHWTIPNAIMMGNAMILKPSEQTPISALNMAKLLKEAGLPDGIFNVVNGGKEIVESICDHPDIKAISFVGSTPIAKLVYQRGSSSMKRVMALGGAKNYLILCPDAQAKASARDIVASATGMSGQRCMAASVLVEVGNNSNVIADVVKQFEDQIAGVDLPPMISLESIAKIDAYLNKAELLGAKILVDGRKKRQEPGYRMGGSIIDWRGMEERMPDEEIFGPVLEILHADTLEDAFAYQNRSAYGNGCSIYTQSGRIAKEAASMVGAGMIGINIGVPVPREPFSFGGIKDSKFGFGNITGKLSLDFWTDLVKVSTKWNAEDKIDWMS